MKTPPESLAEFWRQKYLAMRRHCRAANKGAQVNSLVIRIQATNLHDERAIKHNLLCELGHANDLLDQIQALVDGHGVGLRDAVREVLAGR